MFVFFLRCFEDVSWVLQVLILFKKVLGEKDPATLTAMANLANVWATMGRHLEAEKLGRMVGSFFNVVWSNCSLFRIELRNCYVASVGIGSLHE